MQNTWHKGRYVVLSLGLPKCLHRHQRLVISLHHCPPFGFHISWMMIRSFCGKLKGLSILCTPGVLCDTGLAQHNHSTHCHPSTPNTALINADFPAPDWQLRLAMGRNSRIHATCLSHNENAKAVMQEGREKWGHAGLMSWVPSGLGFRRDGGVNFTYSLWSDSSASVTSVSRPFVDGRTRGGDYYQSSIQTVIDPTLFIKLRPPLPFEPIRHRQAGRGFVELFPAK
ncbi:hypothetical protein B0H17DRAFT_1098663 [Mycena rosella]|uniref:Uncharacterized protein n=1 Tax=Mycena rosella TaxID=1033263 RepID=A0AAD7CPD1_MYCRO|nr:hypothetical protein B0H17DRAFT_1098663 [Mycena rosella]